MEKDLVEKRWQKARRIAWCFQFIPFIRFTSVTGSLAYDQVNEDSDIDFFAVTKANRIWTTRGLVITLLKLLGQLRTEKVRAGKICPNRFVTDDHLVISPQNSYHAQDYTQMVSLFDDHGIYNQFIKENKWMEQYGFFKPKRAIISIHSRTLNIIRRLLEYTLGGAFGEAVENFTKSRQLKSIEKEFPNLNKENSSIIANDREIRIHPRPR